MARLSLSFLGGCEAMLEGAPAPRFAREKARALLAYLAVQQLETSLELRRQLGDRRGLVICLNNLGAAAGRHGDYERSRIYYEEALVLSRELGNPSYIATLLANLGDVAEVQGEHRRAHELFAESLALRRQMGEKMGIAYSLNRLGHNALHQGDIRAAYALQRESLELLCELGDKEHIVACLEGIAAIASVDEPDERAPRLWGATAALREALGVPAPPSKQAEHAPFMARGCEGLGQPAWEEQQARGRALSLAEAIACGLALCERWETPR